MNPGGPTLDQLARGIDGYVGRDEAKDLARLHGFTWKALRKQIKRNRAEVLRRKEPRYSGFVDRYQARELGIAACLNHRSVDSERARRAPVEGCDCAVCAGNRRG